MYFWHRVKEAYEVWVGFERNLSGQFSPLTAPFPAPRPSAPAPLSLQPIFSRPLTALLPLTQFSARFASFFAPISLRSHALPSKHYYRRCTLAPPGEYSWTVRVQWRCGLLSSYFDHFLWPPYVIGGPLLLLLHRTCIVDVRVGKNDDTLKLFFCNLFMELLSYLGYVWQWVSFTW